MSFLDLKIAVQKNIIMKNSSGKNKDILLNKIDSLYERMKNANVNSEEDYSNFLVKKAYPEEYVENSVPRRSMQKWIKALNDINILKNKNLDGFEAFNTVTKDWDSDEKSAFKTWADFYSTGEHMKYKLAQYSPSGYELPLNLKGNLLSVPGSSPEEKVQEKKLSSKQKLLSRLFSAEKIIVSDEFRRAMGSDYRKFLDILHQLKSMVMDSEIKTAATFNDILIREASKAFGNSKSTKLITKLAQTAELPPITPPTEVPAQEDEKSDPNGAVEAFIANLEGIDTEDEKDSSDDGIYDGSELVVDSSFEKTAQIAPPSPEPIKQAPEEVVIDEEPVVTDTAINEPVETDTPPVTENAPIQPEDVGNDDLSPEASEEKTDNAIDAAFANVKLNDVVNRLDNIASMYRHRQMARELSIVDLMMQALGISSFFPNLAEATKSALDSNQYVLSRIEDVLAKLRGASAISDGSLDELKTKLEQIDDGADRKRINKQMAPLNDMTPAPGVETPQPQEQMPLEAPQKALEAPVSVQPNPAPVKV